MTNLFQKLLGSLPNPLAKSAQRAPRTNALAKGTTGSEPPPYLTEKHPAKAKYKRPEKLLQNPDAIVIGSGIGGLGIASILAQRKGWKVLLLEASKTPGGCTHCHEVGGFEFPSGIDSVGDMDASVGRGLFRPSIDYITGGKLQWARMPDLHEISYIAGDRYDWFSSPEKNIAWLEAMFPGTDVKAYYDLEEKIEAAGWAWAVTKLLPDYVPEATREAFYKTFGGAWRKYMEKKTARVLKDDLQFPDKLASIFCYMYGNHGVTPENSPFAFHAVNLFHYRYGAYYPVGGPGQIAECVVPIVEAAGGQLAVDAAVRQILVDGNRATGVELETGEKIYAPLVISDAGGYTTLVELLDPAVSARHGYPDKFKEVRPSVVHLYMLLGYDEDLGLPKEIIWDLPSYDIETTDARYKRERDLESAGLYMLCPSSRDPVHGERYPGKSTVVVLGEAPYAWVERCEKDPVFKKKFEAELQEMLLRRTIARIPQLAGKTPSYIRAGLPMGCNPRAWQSCSLGLESSADRFVKHTHWLRPKTAIENLWLTGQDSFSPGFAGSMLGSRVTYSAMTGDWLFLLKPKPLPVVPLPYGAQIAAGFAKAMGGAHLPVA